VSGAVFLERAKVDATGRGVAIRYMLGLGANLGDRIATLEQASTAIADRLAEGSVRRSSWWLSTAEGGQGPEYVNAVLSLESKRGPHELLAALLAIEASLGRTRTGKNAPRTVDLDILLADRLRLCTADLVVPHPRMHLRAFVLLPLLELDEKAEIPGVGTARQALGSLVAHDCRQLRDHDAVCGTIRA